MISIKVLGSGCAKCKATVSLIEQVAQDRGVDINLAKVEDAQQIMAYKVMSTPAVVVNEVVVHKGGIPRRDQVEQWVIS